MDGGDMAARPFPTLVDGADERKGDKSREIETTLKGVESRRARGRTKEYTVIFHF
jgi:hypothetical protein